MSLEAIEKVTAVERQAREDRAAADVQAQQMRTEAERTGYPWRRSPTKPDRNTLVREFLRERKDDFFRYCLGISEVVDDFLEENRDDFQDWQWDNYRDVGW